MICWETTANILQSIAAVAVTIFAAAGFFMWRREVVGKRKMEVAERALALLYNARMVIEDSRRPSNYPKAALWTGPPEVDHGPEDVVFDSDNVRIPLRVLNTKSKLFSEIEMTMFSFIALFGKIHEEHFEELLRLFMI